MKKEYATPDVELIKLSLQSEILVHVSDPQPENSIPEGGGDLEDDDLFG